MTSTDATVPRLDLGRVIARSFSIIRQRWPVLGFFVLAYLAISWIVRFATPVSRQPGSQDPQRFAVGVALTIALTCIVWLRTSALIATALAPPSVRRSARGALEGALRAFPTLLPFFVVAALPDFAQTFWVRWSGFAPNQIAKASLALSAGRTIYALAIAAGWGVLIPVVLAEKQGLGPSLARAWQLLSGDRWRFLALYVVASVVGFMPAMIASVIMVPIALGMHVTHGLADYFRVELGVTGALSVVVNATFQVMVAVAYLELRRAREGVGVEEASEIFA